MSDDGGPSRRGFVRLALLSLLGALPFRDASARKRAAGPEGSGRTPGRPAVAGACDPRSDAVRHAIQVSLPVEDGIVRVAPAAHPSLQQECGFLPILAGGRGGELIYLLALPRGGYAAVSPTCPHEGCLVGPVGWELLCPCHGSTFTRSGGLLVGPARRPLDRFPVSLQADGTIVITVPPAA